MLFLKDVTLDIFIFLLRKKEKTEKKSEMYLKTQDFNNLFKYSLIQYAKYILLS